jgi:type VI secretion system protein ImpB
MSNESTQKKLSRVRPPRVQITYDVEVGDAIETKELPFVLGVVGDYSGNRKEPPGKLKDRNFVQIDNDNFDDVLKGMAPRLNLQVVNKLQDDGGLMAVELNFDRLDDFEPGRVVNQIDPLNQLLEIRSKLSDLRNKVIGNEKLEEILDNVARDTEKLKQIAAEKPAE